MLGGGSDPPSPPSHNLVTGGGVTSGPDFALTVAAEVYDDATARRVQLALEHDSQPPFDALLGGRWSIRYGDSVMRIRRARSNSAIPTASSMTSRRIAA